MLVAVRDLAVLAEPCIVVEPARVDPRETQGRPGLQRSGQRVDDPTETLARWRRTAELDADARPDRARSLLGTQAAAAPPGRDLAVGRLTATAITRLQALTPG